MQSRKRGISVAISLLVAGLLWLVYTTVRQANLDRTLIMAIQANHTAVALDVLRSGADPSARDYRKSDAPLWQPILQRLERLFARQARPQSDPPPSALALATQHDNSVVIEALLARGATGVNDKVGFQSPGNRLPLLLVAAESGNTLVQRELLAHGANPNVFDQDGHSPLWKALFYHDMDMSLLLIQYGSDVVHQSDQAEEPYLMEAVRMYADPDVLQAMLDRGADINAQDENGQTALMDAVVSEYITNVRFLLAHRATAGIKDSAGRTALYYAMNYNGGDPLNTKAKQIIHLLRQAGAR